MKGSKKQCAGGNYTERDEKYDKKMKKKDAKAMKTAGIATALKKSEKKMGKTDKPKVKPVKKGKGFIK